MKIIKIISNNAVLSYDKSGAEIVVMGKGIGFQKKVGNPILKKEVEKIYKIPKKIYSNFEKIIYRIPYEHIKVADKIIKYATETIGNELNQNIHITLTDHINFAIERKKQSIEIENALLWEIKKFYKVEYKIGLEAINIIYENLNIMLSEHEAGFIALHIVNAQTKLDVASTSKLPKLIDNIMHIIEEEVGVSFNSESLAFERFLIHLKFLVQRIIENDHYNGKDEEFYKMYLDKYKKSADCAYKIARFVKNETNYIIANEELMYISMHIERIASR